VSPVTYEPGFYIPEDDILLSSTDSLQPWFPEWPEER
jgi:hypothetical protein